MSSVADIIAIIKELRNIAKEVKNQPMIDLAVEIQDKIFDLKNEIENLKDENKQLQLQIIELLKAKDIEEDIIPFKEPIFQLKNDAVKSYYCQHCWVKDKKLIKISTYYMNSSPRYECKNCNNNGFLNSDL